MREAINSNPLVQICVVAGLILAVGLVFMLQMKGGAEPAPPATGAPTEAGAVGSTAPGAVPGAPPSTSTGATTPSTAATPATGAATVTAAPGATAPASAPTGTVAPGALTPGPGMPRAVKDAWDRGDAIVLLIVRAGATDDGLVRGSVQALSEPGTTVFVAQAKEIARYSRITQGVGVNRVPALVVIRPRRISGPVPEAQVSYGFRDSQSVVQAVRDALYPGRDDLPYSPG